MFKNIFRRLRGAAGNAIVWCATWFLAGFPLALINHTIFGGWGEYPFWPTALGTAQTMAGLGLFAGAGFSLYLGIAGRKRRLKELKPGWVGLSTALAVGVLVPVFGVYLGDAPLARALEIAAYTGVFSGLSALGQVKIAQKALASGEGGLDELEPGAEQALPAVETETV